MNQWNPSYSPVSELGTVLLKYPSVAENIWMSTLHLYWGNMTSLPKISKRCQRGFLSTKLHLIWAGAALFKLQLPAWKCTFCECVSVRCEPTLGKNRNNESKQGSNTKCQRRGAFFFFLSPNSTSCPSVLDASAYMTFAMRLQVIWEAGIRLQITFHGSLCQDTLPKAIISMGNNNWE